MDIETVKVEAAVNGASSAGDFDINKICRACLGEKDEMRSLFHLTVQVTGQSVSLSEMMSGISSVQITNGDGMPSLVCIQCIHQINSAFSFKQLCEQSDSNLRQYLGLPLSQTGKPHKDHLPPPQTIENSDFTTLLDNFASGFDSTSEDSDDDFDSKLDLSFMSTTDNPMDEKAIAQKQLLKVAKMQKAGKKKKMLAAKGRGPAKKVVLLKKSSYQCNVCKKQLINMKSFRKHLMTHIEDRPFKCKLCPRSFTEENYLNNHMRTHVPEEQKPHECSICQKRFIHATLLGKHMLKHSGEKPFVCKICNKGCYAENSLLKHMKIHEKKEGDPGLLKHICDYCKIEFSDADSLSIHIKQHTGDRPFVCNICGKCFPQRFNLELHLRTHTGERPFQCDVCKNGYVSKASLKIHMRTHTNERPFVCDFCGKAFRQSGDLTSHKRLHGTEKPIECEVCHKRFTTVMKLKYHMRNHTGERPYVCTVCGRGFTVNTILLRHMRVHSGERPYVCVTCGKAFSQSSTLNTHMKVHAPSPKYNQQQERPKFQHHGNEHKYQSQPEQDPLLLPQQQQHQQQQQHRQMNDQRMLPQHQDVVGTRMLSNDGSRILTTTDTNHAHLLAVNMVEPQHRLLVHQHQEITTTSTRLVVTENRLMTNDARLLSDKYLANYDPYHRGHL